MYSKFGHRPPPLDYLCANKHHIMYKYKLRQNRLSLQLVYEPIDVTDVTQTNPLNNLQMPSRLCNVLYTQTNGDVITNL